MSGPEGFSKSRLTKSFPGVKYVGAICHRRGKLDTRRRVVPACTTDLPPRPFGHMVKDRCAGPRRPVIAGVKALPIYSGSASSITVGLAEDAAAWPRPTSCGMDWHSGCDVT